MKKIRDPSLGKRPRIKKVVPIINESMEDQLPQNSGTTEDEKTYEDYNKQQPLFINPNPKRNHQKLVGNNKKKRTNLGETNVTIKPK